MIGLFNVNLYNHDMVRHASPLVWCMYSLAVQIPVRVVVYLSISFKTDFPFSSCKEKGILDLQGTVA